MTSGSMKRMMRYTVTVLRRPDPDDEGKQAMPEVHLHTLRTTPIDPLNTDEFHNLIIRYKIPEPYRIFGCYAETTADVQVGDVLCWKGREFLLRGLGTWNTGDEDLYEMILTEMAA